MYWNIHRDRSLITGSARASWRSPLTRDLKAEFSTHFGSTYTKAEFNPGDSRKGPMQELGVVPATGKVHTMALCPILSLGPTHWSLPPSTRVPSPPHILLKMTTPLPQRTHPVSSIFFPWTPSFLLSTPQKSSSPLCPTWEMPPVCQGAGQHLPLPSCAGAPDGGLQGAWGDAVSNNSSRFDGALRVLAGLPGDKRGS